MGYVIHIHKFYHARNANYKILQKRLHLKSEWLAFPKIKVFLGPHGFQDYPTMQAENSYTDMAFSRHFIDSSRKTAI